MCCRAGGKYDNSIDDIDRRILEPLGHRKDKLINEALQELEQRAKKIKVFRSYPKAEIDKM